jgi:hypothetical protein
MNRNAGTCEAVLPSAVLVLLGEDPGDRHRRVRERDEHVHGVAAVVEANAPEFGRTALRGAVVVFGGCTWCGC